MESIGIFRSSITGKLRDCKLISKVVVRCLKSQFFSGKFNKFVLIPLILLFSLYYNNFKKKIFKSIFKYLRYLN